MKGVGFREYQQLQELEREANELGFALGMPRHYDYHGPSMISLYPLDDAYPSYVRDANFFNGDMEEVQSFLQGVKFTREYYMVHLRLFTEKRIAKKEQDIRNQQLVDKLKQGAEEHEDDIPF